MREGGGGSERERERGMGIASGCSMDHWRAPGSVGDPGHRGAGRESPPRDSEQLGQRWCPAGSRGPKQPGCPWGERGRGGRGGECAHTIVHRGSLGQAPGPGPLPSPTAFLQTFLSHTVKKRRDLHARSGCAPINFNDGIRAGAGGSEGEARNPRAISSLIRFLVLFILNTCRKSL